MVESGALICHDQSMSELSEVVDFAVIAYLDEGEWSIVQPPTRALGSIEALTGELRRYPGETGTLALLTYDEDFVLIIRVLGPTTKVAMSDAAVVGEWTLAQAAADLAGLQIEIDDDVVEPAGDLGILTDLGMSADELGGLFDDLDLYPEEILSEIATKIGIGAKFDELVGLD